MIPRVFAQASAGFETVAETVGRQQADSRTLAFQKSVGCYGRPMQKKLAVAEEFLHWLVQLCARCGQRIDDALARVGGNRRHFEHIGAAVAVGHYEIGKRPTDIDANAPWRCLDSDGHLRSRSRPHTLIT